jgi:hypothetical protein
MEVNDRPMGKTGKTPIALYRQGNANSPRMDKVRPNKNIATYEKNGEVWVMLTLADGKSPGGVSTFAIPGSGKNWWRLDSGVDIPSQLQLVNDRNQHWLWQPSQTMTLDDYQAALREVGAFFTKFN